MGFMNIDLDRDMPREVAAVVNAIAEATAAITTAQADLVGDLVGYSRLSLVDVASFIQTLRDYAVRLDGLYEKATALSAPI